MSGADEFGFWAAHGQPLDRGAVETAVEAAGYTVQSGTAHSDE